MFETSLAYANGIIPGAGGAAGGPAGGIGQFLPLVLMFVIFYFLLIRPQQKKQKEMREMLSNLKRGDRIITGGGIYGRIDSISEDKVNVEIAPGVIITCSRSYVAGLAEADKAQLDKAGKKAEKNGKAAKNDEK